MSPIELIGLHCLETRAAMIAESGVFKFMPSSTGSKTDATTRTVREIVGSEAAARAKKTTSRSQNATEQSKKAARKAAPKKSAKRAPTRTAKKVTPKKAAKKGKKSKR